MDEEGSISSRLSKTSQKMPLYPVGMLILVTCPLKRTCLK